MDDEDTEAYFSDIRLQVRKNDGLLFFFSSISSVSEPSPCPLQKCSLEGGTLSLKTVYWGPKVAFSSQWREKDRREADFTFRSPSKDGTISILDWVGGNPAADMKGFFFWTLKGADAAIPSLAPRRTSLPWLTPSPHTPSPRCAADRLEVRVLRGPGQIRGQCHGDRPFPEHPSRSQHCRCCFCSSRAGSTSSWPSTTPSPPPTPRGTYLATSRLHPLPPPHTAPHLPPQRPKRGVVCRAPSSPSE